ncbi:SAM-dependent methyltransferase [Labrys okinawensis]|uniref:SAM-dependent methyltransferase n=1 Tax=Labrys okinawensis TaxID=346911 RepID=UPI0039BD4C1C
MSKSDAERDLSAMEGDGFYNRHSAMQAAGIELLSSLWQMACQTVTIDDGPLTIVDYGSSQGRNSMAPLRMAIEVLRCRAGSNVPIEVIHTDLPSNDFSALFEALENEPNSYLAGTADVFPAAIGRSFFHRLLPSGRVHLGWTTWALQWMSRSPANAEDHILAGMSQSPEVMKSVRQQQADDWCRFLEVRSSEMRPGAKLLTGFTARTATESGWEWLLGELWSTVEDMGRDGLFSKEERRHITIPIGLRSFEDIQAPFIGSGRFADLVVERLEILKVADPCWDDFQRTGDRLSFAKRHADMTQAWSGPTIARLIDPARDRTSLVAELFARFVERLATNPRKHEPYMAVALLAKTP